MMTFELVLAWGCALVIGYSIHQGGTCGVAAARNLVEQRRIDLFAGFAVATGVAGIVCLPALWLTGTGTPLGGMASIGPRLFVGAVLLAWGAVLNDACLLGSLWRLGNGEMRLLALPVGLAIGFMIATMIPGGLAPHLSPSTLGHPGAAGFIVIAGSSIILALALLVLKRHGLRRSDRWPLAVAMAILGAGGALLYVVQPGWSYADAVKRSVSPLMAMMASGWGGAIAALLTAAGAIVSAVRLRAFKPGWPTVAGVARSLGGGILMAVGATMVPGGNDTLLLASVPAGSVSGAIAYTVMTLVVVVTIALGNQLRPRRDRSSLD
jgi:uncharacterized protein